MNKVVRDILVESINAYMRTKTVDELKGILKDIKGLDPDDARGIIEEIVERKISLRQAIIKKPIPEYGHVMTLDKFKKCCESGGFTDFDGYGYLSTKKYMSDIQVTPSTFDINNIPKKFKYIVWFNR